ncbi:SemiSWEET transporter [Vibrio sp. DW001]|uniref:SemiSWEET family sugar transporter n=1 Tax=Vibrio sp. DW001 TaxID=2912315 RepID=UPI0023AE7D73|nr:SemiSWEET transporter [Vibrio sp. DW001]WED25313.1 SemiSWEET transporter [Vibrio sp. DW001]
MNETIGYFAAFCTTFSFVPQVASILKTKNVDGISTGMYCMFVTGVFSWLIYGIVNQDWPLVIANVITGFLSSLVLILKLTSGRKKSINQ